MSPSRQHPPYRDTYSIIYSGTVGNISRCGWVGDYFPAPWSQYISDTYYYRAQFFRSIVVYLRTVLAEDWPSNPSKTPILNLCEAVGTVPPFYATGMCVGVPDMLHSVTQCWVLLICRPRDNIPILQGLPSIYHGSLSLRVTLLGEWKSYPICIPPPIGGGPS